MSAADPAPLAGIQVVDAVVGPLAPITRYLAELGAQVHRFAPVDADIGDRVANCGKVHSDLPITSPEFAQAIDGAHAIVASASREIDLAALRSRNRTVVTMAVSDFGTGNSLSKWQSTGAVLHALSGELSRSGIRGRAALLPRGDLAYQCASAQAAFVIASGLYRALESGQGAHYDFSALDGAVQALDPGYGISGSATMGRPAGLLSRDRPAAGIQYPILRCADGYVRLCLLAKRQWRAMFAWMNSPEQFAGAEFDSIAHRYKSRELLSFIAAFFASRTKHELEIEGQSRGVPISAVMSLDEFIESDQVTARGAIANIDGIPVPNGVIIVDGQRMGIHLAADVSPPLLPPYGQGGSFPDLKVLDLGIIVVGAEQGRLLADLGADVVKVESRAFPDGNRQSYLSFGMSVSFAAGHRNKRSLGLDLRHQDGRALFLDLVRQADVLCSNFKPHTLDKLGLGPDVLAAINPRLIMSESSAFGASGPWQNRMGYGPLVRAATGVTLAWRYQDDPESFSDAITIYPDHVAGRIAALGVVALLIRRLRTGLGGRSEVSQAEVILSHFAEDVAELRVGNTEIAAHSGPWGVFPAKGEDEWCVVTVRDSADWRALCSVLGEVATAYADVGDRHSALQPVEALLKAWLADRAPMEAAEALQRAGVPAAPMLRLVDLPHFPYFRDRGFYRTEQHPWLREALLAESYSGSSVDVPGPGARPAPLAGEDTRDVIADWLGLQPEAIDALCNQGVLEPLSNETRAAAQRHLEAT